MKNGNEGRDVIGDSRKRYRARGQRKENTDRAEKKKIKNYVQNWLSVQQVMLLIILIILMVIEITWL